MLKRIKALFDDSKGLTLVETLVALTILALVLFCITPLFVINLDTIRVSGDKAVKVYNNAGIMQKILANFETGDETDNAGYDIDVASANITLSGNGAAFSVNAQGDLLVSNPTDISAGYATVMADSPDSTFQVFPKTLTDDFKEAYLTVAAIGFSFVDEPGSSIYELYCNKSGTLTKLKYGDDYIMRRVESNDPTAKNRVMQIVLYGGTDVNFSNSPLTFKYKGYQKNIQVDAPSIIMVGEKSSDGYRYYVSRGEMEKDSNGNDRLIVLERYMDGAPLTSAMNDVEWVSAEDSDQYAVGKDGEKYGYYVMCGDNGQIRRFWQNKTTGNYYWGGDYTYYTDINLNRAEGGSYIKTTGDNDDGNGRTLSTSVSYKFLARRTPVGTEGTMKGLGYQLVHGTTGSTSTTGRKEDAIAYTSNMWTVTAANNNDAYFYTSDGKILYWYMDQGSDSISSDNGLTINNFGDKSFESVKNAVYGKNSVAGKKIRGTGWYHQWNFEDLGWVHANPDSYYAINGINPSEVNTASYPITLTSVDAIVLQGSENVGDSSAYAGSTSSFNYDVSDGGAKIDNNLSAYPTSTYTLYCGYIPSAYDVWSFKPTDKSSTSFYTKDGKNAELIVAGEPYNANNAKSIDSPLNRYSNTLLNSSIEKLKLWRGTFGVTPYFTSGTSPQLSTNPQLIWQGSKKATEWFKDKWWFDYMYYWPYTNVQYAVTGKFFDAHTDTSKYTGLFSMPVSAVFNEGTLYTTWGDKNLSPRQEYLTGGDVIDITCSYFSHPFALHIAANPSIHTKAFMLDNEVGTNQFSYYYANRRETVTILDIASTKIPVPSSDNKAEAKDIAVSLAAGYAQGGSVTFSQMDTFNNFPAYVNNIMPIGIVYLRAGTAELSKQAANGNATGEYQAVDKDGYKLQEESNYFHQFYYLNSKLDDGYKNPNGKNSTNAADEYNFLGTGLGAHVGNMYGAKYWQNNRHIRFRSAQGGAPDKNDHNKTPNGNYNYVRCHPLVDTKVTCVAWGTTWNNYPEAMWGTDNGTVLSWFVNLNKVQNEASSEWNDKHVVAEFQSYEWIDNVEGKGFTTNSGSWKNTIGAHTNESDDKPNPATYPYSTSGKTIDSTFRTFFDKMTQENKYYEKGYGFISTLSTINDIAYANDYWVAVGNQATGKQNLRGNTISPALYCGNKTLTNPNSAYYGGSQEIRAYSGDGTDGSWVNVRYWFDEKGTGKQADDNSTYLWKAVKISNNRNYNIVQINALNGVWYATGYEDKNGNGEWDNGERAVVCWARDPLAACDAYDGLGKPAEGRWSENTQFYRTTGKGQYQAMSASDVGGINSVACRDDM